MKTTKKFSEFIDINNGKNIVSFNPPAYGKLYRSILTGEYVIKELRRVVPITFDQAEDIIKNNFSD